jgi:tetrahydromethanopterin S-methyltransferase subunit G
MSETTTETVTLEVNDFNVATLLVGLLARIATQEGRTKVLEGKEWDAVALKLLQDKVNELDGQADSIREDVTNDVKDQLDRIVDDKMDDLPDFRQMESRLDDLEYKVENDLDVTDLQSRVDDLENKPDPEDLESRITSLEKHLDNAELTERLAKLEATLQRIKEVINA